MKDCIITIIGTKNVNQEDSEFKIYNKEEAIERITELMDECYGFSIVQSRK